MDELVRLVLDTLVEFEEFVVVLTVVEDVDIGDVELVLVIEVLRVVLECVREELEAVENDVLIDVEEFVELLVDEAVGVVVVLVNV